MATLKLKIKQIDGLTSTLDAKADKADTYTKTEVDGKIVGVYKFKGSVDTVGDLPVADQTLGDVYNVKEDGMNYAWDGTEWDALGSHVDLTGFYTKTEIDTKVTDLTTEIDKKQDKAPTDGKFYALKDGALAEIPATELKVLKTMSLSAQIDGVTQTFTLSEGIGDDALLYYNGLLQNSTDNYTTDKTSSLTTLFDEAPVSGESLIITYWGI